MEFGTTAGSWAITAVVVVGADGGESNGGASDDDRGKGPLAVEGPRGVAPAVGADDDPAEKFGWAEGSASNIVRESAGIEAGACVGVVGTDCGQPKKGGGGAMIAQNILPC